MRWYHRLFRRARTEKRLGAELRFHLEQQVADYVAAQSLTSIDSALPLTLSPHIWWRAENVNLEFAWRWGRKEKIFWSL